MFDFSPLAQLWLRTLGWYPERRVDPTPWIDSLTQEQGFRSFPLLEEVLSCVGGLPDQSHDDLVRVAMSAPHGQYEWLMSNARCIHFYPELSAHNIFEEWNAIPWIVARNLSLCSIGMYDTFQGLFLCSDGALYYGDYYEKLKPTNPDDALDELLGGGSLGLKLLGTTFAEGIHTLALKTCSLT